MFADTERYERAAAQRYKGQERNDQPVSIFEGVRLGLRSAASASATAWSIELDPERVEAVAGHQVIFPGFTRGRGLDALGDVNNQARTTDTSSAEYVAWRRKSCGDVTVAIDLRIIFVAALHPS